MMHECKRLLNDSTVSDGLLFPGRRAARGGDGVAHLLVVPRAVAVGADACPHGVGCAGTQHISSESTSNGDGHAG